MSWINVSFSIPYWLPPEELVLAWCLLGLLEVVLCAINAVMYELRKQTATAVFRERGNRWWNKWHDGRCRPGRAGRLLHTLSSFLLWPIGLPREIKTLVFQIRLDWLADAERLESEVRRYRRSAG